MSDVELDEAELFNSAVSDEPDESAAQQIDQLVTEPPVQQEKTATIQEPVPAESELTAEKPPIPPKPEWRLREDAERARTAEADLANERAEKAALKQRLEALERASQPTAPKIEKPAKPDPLLDPEGYEQYLEQKFEEKQLAKDRETSLRTAARTYKGEFDEAYKAAQSKVDPALRAMMQASDDPGETLIKWHRSEKAKAEVGTDLAAYKAKLRDEALKDPEFRKAAMEAWRAEGGALDNNGRPRIDMGNKPLMAPSMSGTSRANASLRSSQDDVSDAELFAQTTG